MCMEFKPNYLQMELIGIFHSILKSILFNIVMFIFGFLIGTALCIHIIHDKYSKNENNGCIQKLNEVMDEPFDIDCKKEIIKQETMNRKFRIHTGNDEKRNNLDV